MGSSAKRSPKPARSAEEEFEALLADRNWRLRNLYWILDENGQRVQFQPNWAQLQLFDNLERKNVDLKVRQIGATTGYCILWLDTCLFTPNMRIGIVAHTKDDAQVIFRDKIKYAYENLPPSLRTMCAAVKMDEGELGLSNGSSIRVAVSFRSGTVQVLHVTEYGTICAKYPVRANEVKTGALQAVPKDGIVVIESTAKGRVGHFYDLVQEAHKRGNRRSPYDWKLTFLPWWKDPRYAIDEPGFVFTEAELKYLHDAATKAKTTFTPGQKVWWARKQRDLGEDIYAEYPSTIEEAFRQTAEGAYYGSQMMALWRNGKIAKVPIEEALLVDTWWDIGRDTTSIWFVQEFGREIRLVSYYSSAGEGLPHFKRILDEFAEQHRIRYGRHIGPHDLKVKDWGGVESRLMKAQQLGITFEIAPTPQELSLEDGIEAVRSALPRCIFDEERCARGIAGLEHYRKEWDPVHGVWKDVPLHDWASHPADAFRYGATTKSKAIIRGGSTRARKVKKVVWTAA